MNKVIGAIIIILVLIILIVVFVSWKVLQSGRVEVSTEKTEYKIGDVLRVNIENNLKKSICFSACYPYYIEKKDGENWESYQYSSCLEDDLADNCIDSRGIKGFEFILSSIEKGLHRLAIPACIDCNGGESFGEEQWFYSNEFIIK